MQSRKLSVGKMRGLYATSNKHGVFSVLAFDHRQSFVRMLNPNDPDSVSYNQVAVAKLDVVQSLAGHASAVLLDPEFGAAQSVVSGVLPKGTGLMVAVDETGYSGEVSARLTTILDGWSVEKAKRMGSDSIKLLVYYHPDAGEATDKQNQLVQQVAESCEVLDIAFFLEPVTYSIDPQMKKDTPGFAALRPKIITETARRLSQFQPDVLKLEFPLDADYEQDENKWLQACQAVTEASSCPWTLLSAGVSYPTFLRQVEIACRGGASGFIGGRAVWKDGLELPASQRTAWFQVEGTRRLDELQQVASRYATPFWDYYPLEDASEMEGWYARY